MTIPVFFHRDQLLHKPLYEWSFGEKILHPETTARAESINNALVAHPNLFTFESPVHIPIEAITSVHSQELIRLYRTSMGLNIDNTFYPSVFPKQSDKVTPSPDDIHHAGYFCFDSGTPLNSTTYSAAGFSAACAYEAALAIRDSKSRVAYALCRPPGHHAGSDYFGGYCYYNNSAIAARTLEPSGKVAILDIDFHHGNGTQDIFYENRNVLVVNLHGDPKHFYPFFWGHETERGAKDGLGFNLNIPIAAGCDAKTYLRHLEDFALPEISKFAPKYLIVSAGFDTYVGDPVGRFALETPDFKCIGEKIKSLNLPTLIIQEGGYVAESLGPNVLSLLSAFIK